MARTLKTRGIAEVDYLRKRTARQYALGRIYRVDRDFIMERLDAIADRIVSMQELNEQGEEEGGE